MTKTNFYFAFLLLCFTIFTAKAFQLNVVDSNCDYTDWYKPPNCNNCIASVELIEFKGKQYVAFWADHTFCSDAQTIIYNCDGTVFCIEGGFGGDTECSDKGVFIKSTPNYTVISTIWSNDKNCNTCCDNFIIYGDEHRNIPTAVKHYDGFTYVAGTIETNSVYATFTKFDATNSVVWEKQLDHSSTIVDFVKTDDGFLLVGRTEPAMDNGPQNNRSILAKIDDIGNEVFIRSYDNGQRENFVKIVEHPQAVDTNFPYYILAYENVSETNVSYADEVQLYNVNANGDINWQVAYTTVAPNSFLDDQFARSLVTTSDGNLLLLGDFDGNSITAAMLKVSGNNGSVLSSFEGNNNTSFFDAKESSTGNIVLTGSQYNNGMAQAAFFMLLDPSLNVISSVVQNQVQSIRTLLVDGNDDLYGIGQLPGNVPCIVKAEVNGSQIVINEVKAIPGDALNYHIPVAQLAGNTLHYADGRDEIPGNNMDVFLGYFDTALNDDCLERVPFITDAAKYTLSPLTVNIADHVLPNPNNAIDLIDIQLSTEMDCEEPDVCCVDEQAFLDRVTAPILTNGPEPGDCELSIVTIQLTECDQVYIDWGDDYDNVGPFMGNINLTHLYNKSDIYEVCLKFAEIDEDGTACWKATECFEVKTDCPPSDCCVDEADFRARIKDYTTTLEGCELNVVTNALTECDQVVVDWGVPPIEGPFMGNIDLTHEYITSGTYTVCLYFTEIDDRGTACWEAAECFKVDVNCDCCDEIEALKDRVSYLEELVIGLTEKLEQLNKKADTGFDECKLQIYPNPNSGIFYAEYVVKEHSNNAKLVITNAEGIEVSTSKINCTGNCKSDLTLPANLSAGIYYCTLYVNDTLIESTPFVYQN